MPQGMVFDYWLAGLVTAGLLTYLALYALLRARTILGSGEP